MRIEFTSLLLQCYAPQASADATDTMGIHLAQLQLVHAIHVIAAAVTPDEQQRATAALEQALDALSPRITALHPKGTAKAAVQAETTSLLRTALNTHAKEEKDTAFILTAISLNATHAKIRGALVAALFKPERRALCSALNEEGVATARAIMRAVGNNPAKITAREAATFTATVGVALRESLSLGDPELIATAMFICCRHSITLAGLSAHRQPGEIRAAWTRITAGWLATAPLRPTDKRAWTATFHKYESDALGPVA